MRILTIAIAIVTAWLVAPTQGHAACGKVTIAEMTWASAAVGAHVQKVILESGFGCDVELVPGDTVPTSTSMAEKGEPDIAPEMWLVSTREVIERAVKEGRVKIVGQFLADGGDEGWWVSEDFVKLHPELTSIEAVLKRPDLFPDREEPGKGRFYGCPAGWGCQITNANLFAAYKMKEKGFTLFDPGSGVGLAGAIAKAVNRGEPILTYYWAPTALLGKYKMVKLSGMTHDPSSWDCMTKPDCANPKPNGYPKSEVVTVVTTRFAKESPEATEFLANYSWPNSVVNRILAWKDGRQATAPETAEYFLKTFESVWRSWVPAKIASKVKSAI